jgi:CMP-N-acetylneuraminic acid synthetase
VPFLDGPPVLRRQDKPRVFARNGPAVLAVRTAVVQAGSLYGDDIRPLVMEAAESLDVDSPADIELLEYLLARPR